MTARSASGKIDRPAIDWLGAGKYFAWQLMCKMTTACKSGVGFFGLARLLESVTASFRKLMLVLPVALFIAVHAACGACAGNIRWIDVVQCIGRIPTVMTFAASVDSITTPRERWMTLGSCCASVVIHALRSQGCPPRSRYDQANDYLPHPPRAI